MLALGGDGRRGEGRPALLWKDEAPHESARLTPERVTVARVVDVERCNLGGLLCFTFCFSSPLRKTL